MDCPVCGGATVVADSRGAGDQIKRRRRCRACGYRFNTIELDMDQYERMIRRESANERS